MLDIQEMYPRVEAELAKVLDFDRFSVNLVDNEGGLATVVYCSGAAVPGRLQGDTFPASGNIVELSARTRQTIKVRDTRSDGEHTGHPGVAQANAAGIRSIVCVPLVSNDQANGALIVSSHRRHA